MFAVPGKPPTNVSAESTSSTTIQVTWCCADCHLHSSTIGFLVSYKLDTSNQTVAVVVNRTARYVLISELKKFTNYTIHVSSVTMRGTGMASVEVSIRTLEDGKRPKLRHCYLQKLIQLETRFDNYYTSIQKECKNIN